MRYKQKHGGKERWDDAAIGTLSSGMGGVASEQGWAEAPKALDFEAADELAHSADRSKDRIGKADELRSQGASAPGLSESEISAMSTPNQQSQAKYRQFSPANLVIGGFAKSMPQIQLPFLRVQGSSCLGKDLRLSSASADDSLCIVGHSMQQHTPICKQEGDQSTSPLSLLTPVGGQPSFLSEAHDSEALLNNSTILSNSIEEEVPCSCEEKGADSPEMSRIRDFMQVRHFAEHDVSSEGLDEDQDESPHMGRRLFGISSKSNVPPADDMDMDNELCGTPIVCMNACTPTASAAVANQFGLLAGTIPPSPEPIRSKQKGRTALLKREDFTPYLQRAASALLYEMHYESIEMLGKGSFGEVWSARHHRTGKMFALKKSMRQYRGKKDKDLHLREIESVAQLPHHPNLVQYYRAWQDAGHFYIVMELCTGGTLKHLMEDYHGNNRLMDVDHIRHLSSGLLKGLQRIHSAGLLHLDLKTDNLFLTDNKQRIKIGDFGLCLKAQDWTEEEGDREYLALEILQEIASPSADIFSAGLIIYQMLIGVVTLPGYGEAWHYLRAGNVEFTCPHPAGQDMVREVKRMLAHDPANRPSAAELLAGGAFAVPESPHEMSPSERLEISFPGGVNQSVDHAGDMEED